jgi:hypothetical protein
MGDNIFWQSVFMKACSFYRKVFSNLTKVLIYLFLTCRSDCPIICLIFIVIWISQESYF